MTSKQRLYNVFNQKKPDRVPIWTMFPYIKEPFAADVNNIKCYEEVVKYVKRYTDYIERNSIDNNLIDCILFNHPDIQKKHEKKELVGEKLIIDAYEYKDIRFEKVKRISKNGQTHITNYLKDIDDLQKIMDIPFKKSEIDISKYKKIEKNLGENGVAGVQFYDSVHFIHDICSETDFVIWAFTHTQKIKEYLDMIQARIESVYSTFLENNIGYVFWVSGPEFLCPPFASPTLFHELVTGNDKRLVDFIRGYGKKSLLHCHGNIKEVLHEIKEINPDALHPIEASPPNGNCTLKEAREVLGSEIILTGNIQYSDLAERSAEEIDQLVKDAINDGGPENFILSPTCTPYESFVNEKIQENYIAFIKAGIKYGKIN